MTNTDKILNSLIIKKAKQIDVASEMEMSRGYISSINKKVDQLKYKPVIENDKLRCLLCTNTENLIISTDTNTGRPIAILCSQCSREHGTQTEFEDKILNTIINDNIIDTIDIITTFPFDMFKKIDALSLKLHCNNSAAIMQCINNLRFLHKFMMEYTVLDSKKTVPIKDRDEIDKIDEVIKCLD